MKDIFIRCKQKFKTVYKDKRIQYVIHTLVLLFFSLFVMITTFLNASAIFNKEMFMSYFADFEIILYNFIPILACMFLLFIASKRMWVGFGLTAYLFYILSLVNKFKLRFRDDPLIFSDFKLLNEAKDMSSKYDISLSLNQILILVFILVLTLLLKKFYKNIHIQVKTRFLGSAAIVSILLLVVQIYLFEPSTYNRLGDQTLISIYSSSQQYQSKGFVYPFVHSYKSLKVSPPPNYDKNKAKKVLSSYTYDNMPDDKKVNVIAVMLESFNDLGKFEGVEFENDVYSKFYKLQKESISGNIISNVFAGGTVNTERAFLNGYHEHLSYPAKTNSFVWYFNQQGYYTEAMHPSYGWFYNRRNVNERLGFQNFNYLENHYEFIRNDEDLFQDIILGYENNNESESPYFNFTITYQGHGPYSTQKLSDIDYLKWKEGYNEADYNNINNYLSSIADTVNQIDELITYFETQEESVVVVLFGDHNPLLNDNSTGFSMLDVNMDISDVEGFHNFYEIPYVIWGNQAAKDTLQKDFVGKGETISPNLLMNEVFQYIGWEGNEYMQYLTDIRTSVDVFSDGYKKIEGEWVKELDPSQLKIIEDYEAVEFYYQNHYQE